MAALPPDYDSDPERDEVRRFCRHNGVPADRAETVELPRWPTKRGVIVRATET